MLSPWNVLYVIGKVLKSKCPKWPRMSHLDICSPTYGQKKGRESNWQFDSQPLKVENRPLPEVRFKSATWLESSLRGLQLCFRPHCYWTLQSGVMSSQSRGTPTRDNFGTPIWESWEKVPFGCSPRGELQRIHYGGRWWLPPSPGRGESCV